MRILNVKFVPFKIFTGSPGNYGNRSERQDLNTDVPGPSKDKLPKNVGEIIQFGIILRSEKKRCNVYYKIFIS
jgi:hypothetical protein